MLKEHTKKVLEEFAEAVKRSAEANHGGKINGWSSDIKVGENWITLALGMNEYLHYQDQGVKGVKGSARASSSPFQFGSGKSKGIGIQAAILRWVKSKRIQFKDRKAVGGKGRFISYERTARLISRSIYDFGLRPSKFMTKALEKEFKTLPDEITEAYGLDIDKFLAFAFKDNIKSFK